MSPEAYIRAQVAEFAWKEGSLQGGINNALAVAFVIKNRVRAGWGDWLALINNAAVHSSRNEADIHHPDIDPRHPDFQRFLQEVDGVFDGSLVDKFTVAPKLRDEAGRPGLYYGKLNEITREWFVENIVRKPEIHPRTSQVGEIVFFG